ncbi:hypothetical protein V8C26DRAFT_394897 [Trichoderma gracile]
MLLWLNLLQFVPCCCCVLVPASVFGACGASTLPCLPADTPMCQSLTVQAQVDGSISPKSTSSITCEHRIRSTATRANRISHITRTEAFRSDGSPCQAREFSCGANPGTVLEGLSKEKGRKKENRSIAGCEGRGNTE